jgi:hypothetical protein
MSGAVKPTQTSATTGAPEMERVVDQLNASVRARLREAGVLLPEALLDQLTEDLLADAIHVALGWLEGGSTGEGIRLPAADPRAAAVV